MQSASICSQGHKGKMEDFLHLEPKFIEHNWLFCGVYDGHSGSFAAKYAADNLHLVLKRLIQEGMDEEKAFADAYEEISRDLEDQDSGTTAVNLLIKEDREIVLANAGDSRALLVQNQGCIQLSQEHRVENPEERNRILKSGGRISGSYVMHSWSGLMPTRSLGDPFFKPVGIISTPYVKKRKISEQDLMLILATDGLFDFMNNNEVCALAQKEQDPEILTQNLEEEVLIKRYGYDNLSILAIKL